MWRSQHLRAGRRTPGSCSGELRRSWEQRFLCCGRGSGPQSWRWEAREGWIWPGMGGLEGVPCCLLSAVWSKQVRISRQDANRDPNLRDEEGEDGGSGAGVVVVVVLQ